MPTFIGPKPAGDVPAYATPFRADDTAVYDAYDRKVAFGDTPSAADDPLMAEAIAEALNAKFAPAENATVEPAPARLRTFIAWRSNGEFVDGERVYEVSPGRYCWDRSRVRAETNGFTWAGPNVDYRFVDVETGAHVDGSSL